jgi:phosphosulfolactate phosphohydrolase-like enzyme
VILRSSSGTQGAIAVRHSAGEIIITGYSTASAVAKYIQSKAVSDLNVTLIRMGTRAMKKSVEDESCGDYIEHLLTNKAYDHAGAIWNCMRDPAIAKTLRGERSYMPKEDVILALQRDLFDFVMVGQPVGNYVEVSLVQP